MNETIKGIKEDLRKLRQRIIIRLIKWLTGKKTIRDPIDVLWEMIDKENQSEEPDCIKIEAWVEAANRIGNECFGVV